MISFVDIISTNQIKIGQLLGVIVALLGALIMSGWYVHSIPLIQIHPSFVPMQFNTALGFLLSGISLLLTLKKQARLAAGLGIIISLMAGLTLFEYINQIDFGIDQLFMTHYITTNTPFPGRMAANTAFCFFISGMALVLINMSTRLNQVSILGAVISGLGLNSFLGYLIGIETAYGWGSFSQMAVHTSVGFILLGISISLGINNFTSKSNHVVHIRNLLSISVTFLVLVISLWQALDNWENNKFDLFLDEQLENIHDTKKVILQSHIHAFERMAQRWVSDKVTPEAFWEADANSYIRHFKDLRAIEWVDESLHVRKVVPLKGNEAVLGFNLATGERRLAVIRDGKKQTTLSLPINLVQGGYGLLLYTPLYIEQKFKGYIVGVIDLQEFLINTLQQSPVRNNYKLSIYDQGSLLVSNVIAPSELVSSHKKTSTFTFMGTTWRTELTPINQLFVQHKSSFPLIVLIFGIMMTGLITLLINISYRERIKTKQLEVEIGIRKNVQHELFEKGELLSTTLENMLDAVILINEKGTVLSFNKAAEQIFGYLFEEVYGKNINMLMPEPFHTQHDSYLKNYIHSGEAKIIGKGREVKGLRANGEVFPMTLAVSDIQLKGKHFFSGIVRDITQQKQSEEEIQQYTAQLERSNEELDNFAYVASHDLKAPLRGIMQLANWIQEDIKAPLESQTSEYLALMRNRIMRLESLLDDLLAYSRLGRKHGDFKLINVADTVNEIFELVGSSTRFQLVCNIGLSEITTLSTPLELILRNLISNAIKHHDSDNGVITVTAKEAEDGFVFTVEDDGPGIAPRHHERVFGLFQTLKPRDEVEGSGMGLAMIKKVLANYDCTIELESDGVRGTKFSFNWPNDTVLRSYVNE